MKIERPNSKGVIAKISTILLLTFAFISCSKENISFDGNEILTKIETYNPSTQTTTALEYKYDNFGKLIEIVSSGNPSSDKQTFLYDANGNLISNTLSNNLSVNLYKYDFVVDSKGRIIKATGTSFLSNLTIANHTYTYDIQGRLIIDSVFNQSGSIHSYINFTYDNNNNVIEYQQFVNHGTSIIKSSTMVIEYDSKRSPYFRIGQTLYTSLGGSVSYFYLSKNNPIKATLNNTVITPGGNFIYQYYPNSLLRTSTANVANSIVFTFYYN
jgi:YD repeat-containing protein